MTSTLSQVFIIVSSMKFFQQSSVSALVEILLLFSPAHPAYLWLWPNVQGTGWSEPVQVMTYFYFLGGSLFIGLRRWKLDRLGLSRKGMGMSLLFGLVFILGRSLAYLSTNLPLESKPFSLPRIAGEILFYFVLVGFVEEFLFRGLIYRALEDWRGVRLAIWGSTYLWNLPYRFTRVVGSSWYCDHWSYLCRHPLAGRWNPWVGIHPWSVGFHRR